MTEIDRHQALCEALTGRFADATGAKRTWDDFVRWWDEIGGTPNFSALEMVDPRYPDLLVRNDAMVRQALLTHNKPLYQQLAASDSMALDILVSDLVTLTGELPRRQGMPILLPPPMWWPRIKALALMAQGLRNSLGKPISVAHVWRPPPYNAACSGASSSDHQACLGIDLDLPALSKRKALKALDALYDQRMWGIALGRNYRGGRIHVGVLTRQREW